MSNIYFKSKKESRLKRWDAYSITKKAPICYVCGKRIPMFGGGLVHKGECSEVYRKAFTRYRNEMRKLPLDNT